MAWLWLTLLASAIVAINNKVKVGRSVAIKGWGAARLTGAGEAPHKEGHLRVYRFSRAPLIVDNYLCDVKGNGMTLPGEPHHHPAPSLPPSHAPLPTQRTKRLISSVNRTAPQAMTDEQ